MLLECIFFPLIHLHCRFDLLSNRKKITLSNWHVLTWRYWKVSVMLQTRLKELLKSWIWWGRLNQTVTLSCKQQGESQASHVDFKCPRALVLKIWGLVPPEIKRGVKSDHGLSFISSLAKIGAVRDVFRAFGQVLWDLSAIQGSEVSPSTPPALFWWSKLLTNRIIRNLLTSPQPCTDINNFQLLLNSLGAFPLYLPCFQCSWSPYPDTATPSSPSSRGSSGFQEKRSSFPNSSAKNGYMQTGSDASTNGLSTGIILHAHPCLHPAFLRWNRHLTSWLNDFRDTSLEGADGGSTCAEARSVVKQCLVVGRMCPYEEDTINIINLSFSLSPRCRRVSPVLHSGCWLFV